MQDITNSFQKRSQKNEATTWEECKKWVKNDGTISEQGSTGLRRTLAMENRYKLQREDRGSKWVSYADFIRCHVFKQKHEEVKVKRSNEEVVLLKSPKKKGRRLSNLQINDFPYTFAENIEHAVLFSTDSMDKKNVERMIEEKYPNKEYLWWRNPANKQSIPDVWHVQVLIKNDSHNINN